MSIGVQVRIEVCKSCAERGRLATRPLLVLLRYSHVRSMGIQATSGVCLAITTQCQMQIRVGMEVLDLDTDWIQIQKWTAALHFDRDLHIYFISTGNHDIAIHT